MGGVLGLFTILVAVSNVTNVALILRVEASGYYSYYNKWGSPGEAEGQFRAPVGVAIDSSGDVYVADANNGRIQKFDSIGTFIKAWGTEELVDAEEVALDSLGRLYVADGEGGDKIVMFVAAGADTGSFIKKWGTYGSANGQFKTPNGVAVDTSGNVYVADSGQARIQKFQLANPCPVSTTEIAPGVCFVTKWGTPGSGDGQFKMPNDVAVDSSGNVYVADTNNNRIQKFTSAGTFIGAWGTLGSGDGQFNEPLGVAVDSLDRVYVADTSNNRIQKFQIQKFGVSLPCPEDTTQIVFGACLITKWGTYGSDNGQFKYPIDMAVDSSGDVYVTDTQNNRIQVFFWRELPVGDSFPDILVYAVVAMVAISWLLYLFRSRLSSRKVQV